MPVHNEREFCSAAGHALFVLVVPWNRDLGLHLYLLTLTIQLAAYLVNGLRQILLAQAEGNVPAGLFDDAPRHVCLTAQTVCDSIGIIHGHQHGIDLIHKPEQAFSFLRVAVAEDIEGTAAQFAHHFSQTVEIGRFFDEQLLGSLKRLILNQSTSHTGFHEFLQGVLGSLQRKARGS